MKFSVFGLVTGTKYLGVYEAETAEDAVDAALSSEANHVSICNHCSQSFDLDDRCCHEATAEPQE